MLEHIVKPHETLWEIAENYRMPMETLMTANQIQNPNLIYAGQALIIPGLPSPSLIPYTIIVSLSQRTLTLLEEGSIIKVYPIAVGAILHETPVGEYVVVNRAPNPGGPFGTMWLSLSKKHYGIHGTNDPSSIGKAVSRGCIRMYNEDVEELAAIIPNGTRVIIQP
ncbi:L,D-transpeptidase family protein [Alkalihalobacterium bogoriense]|uniref:L,D-transpeptidase family protein n=1 Tax=Alkalihalobacterium bogoriense TaxID=246272 RepID=UPI00047E50B7|nr:L,D-transpeptidase family protein [Alkalihalobacterium bogoriense]